MTKRLTLKDDNGEITTVRIRSKPKQMEDKLSNVLTDMGFEEKGEK